MLQIIGRNLCWNKNYKIVTMIISCASVLESPFRGASNTLPYDIIELLVIKEQVGFLQKRNPIRGVQYFPIPIAMNIK